MNILVLIKEVPDMLSERTESQLLESVRSINEICRANGSGDCLYAGKRKEQDELLLIRSQHYELIKDEICDSFDMPTRS